MLAVETDDRRLVQSYPTYVIKKIKITVLSSNFEVKLHRKGNGL